VIPFLLILLATFKKPVHHTKTMLNKRGKGMKWVWWVVIVAVIIVLIWLSTR